MFVATSKQMKAYDQALLDEGYLIEELVDKASNVLLLHFAGYKKIVIISGPGNNGADGISLAIKLHQQQKEVTLVIIGEFERLSLANQFYLEQAKELSIATMFLEDETMTKFEELVIAADVVVDGIFGFGLHSEPRGIVVPAIEIINQGQEIIAIDIPTGLQCDTGIPFSNVICATKTITLTALKQGFLNEESHMYTGDILLETLDTRDLHEEMGLAKLLDDSWIKYHLKPRLYHGHKGDYGKVIHITGSDAYRGAALLSARASVFSGSGIVKVCSTNTVLQSLSSMTPECICELRESGCIAEALENQDAILVGCGLGLSVESEQYVLDVITHATVPIVIDADALTIVARNKDILLNATVPIILTPHHGEFKRFVDYQDEIEMVDLAREFASEYQVILVLKGPNTLITDGEEVYRNTTANKAMATGGMGDVLAGMVVSFIGQGYSPKNAALLATYLHGYCGDIVAKDNYTVLPSQLIEEIPKQMLKLIELI